MSTTVSPFDLARTIHHLTHHLPAQAPLKNFVHHNTLHAFQDQPFYQALAQAAATFGYKVSLSLGAYRRLYAEGRIHPAVLRALVAQHKGEEQVETWLRQLLHQPFDQSAEPRIGQLRQEWKTCCHIDLDALVHPLLFRTLCSYLDQGISVWDFPQEPGMGFLDSLRALEKNAYGSMFRSQRARERLLDPSYSTIQLLQEIVGDPLLFERYLFDQQFAHQGWSGMVAAVEAQPADLLQPKQISLEDLIHFELLLELDALETHQQGEWAPLASYLQPATPWPDLFAPPPPTPLHEVLRLWQEALEWSYYDQVLAGLQQTSTSPPPATPSVSFQALFCIDDRAGSLRRYLEQFDPHCDTYGLPGFFGVEFYFHPEHSKFYIKSCPVPVTPRHLIKEKSGVARRRRDPHFSKHAQSFHSGWLIAQSLGFWSAIRLFFNLFRPSPSPASVTSFQHMDKHARLTIEHELEEGTENGLQVGYTLDEMVDRVERVLRSIGLVKDFAPLIYVVGHGASSVNNPHYAAYDCGACSGRAGSVNARVFCHLANLPTVRERLAERGLVIPPTTQFVGGLHDTTRDDVEFFDEDNLSEANAGRHLQHQKVFAQALDYNAKERSRRFGLVPTPRLSAARIHELVRRRSMSLFEPRPELNHATNALCIVGPRALSKQLFLDRRAFLQSYDHHLDPHGDYLLGVLQAVTPVCGGINLEYYFSKVDNQKLGAGSKLPHNVMGLFGVANGIDGDLRPGLPNQMVEAHDPLRLLLVVHHNPAVVKATLQRAPQTLSWFTLGWMWLAVIDPDTHQLWVWRHAGFEPYQPTTGRPGTATDLSALIASSEMNFPVYLLK